MRTLAQSLRRKVHRLLAQGDAATATEYAVMLALIIVVSLAAISSLGNSLTNNVAWTVTSSLNG